MASASSPERPVVLRRLGIMKESDEPRLQDSRAQRDAKQQDALELFATETDSSSTLQQWLSAAGASGAAAARAALQNRMVAIVLVAALAFAGSIWGIDRYFASSGTPEQETAVAGADDAASASSADAAASTSNQSTKRAGSVNATSGRAGSGSARAQQTVAGSVREDVAVSPLAAATNTASSDLLNGTAASLGAAASAPAEASSVADEASADVDETIYSAQDRDVIPPHTSEPLPAPTFSGAWLTRTNSMEVIVSETGTVERVRMLTPPQRMPDVLELSRAKVWKFTPAMKDGRPVRYRLLLKWEVNP